MTASYEKQQNPVEKTEIKIAGLRHTDQETPCAAIYSLEVEFHILVSCENLECWRNQILPEWLLNSGRGNLACWVLMVNPDNWLNVRRFLDKVRKIQTLLFD